MKIVSKAWKIPKALHDVELWVHPEGLVVGALFVNLESGRFASGQERPLEVLNDERRFVVVKRAHPEGLRFYNRSAIVRVEYRDRQPVEEDVVAQRCMVHLMDDSLIEGTMMKSLPPDQTRLLDFLNVEDEIFMTIYGDDDRVCLVNKSYVVCVTPMDA